MEVVGGCAGERIGHCAGEGIKGCAGDRVGGGSRGVVEGCARGQQGTTAVAIGAPGFRARISRHIPPRSPRPFSLPILGDMIGSIVRTNCLIIHSMINPSHLDGVKGGVKGGAAGNR